MRGEEAAQEAMQIANNIFKSNISDSRINNFKINVKNIADNSFSIIDAVEKLNLVNSRSEIKRLIKSKGIKINDVVYDEKDFSLDKYVSLKEIKISVGKKKIGILKLM